jgi:hypothetical protein
VSGTRGRFDADGIAARRFVLLATLTVVLVAGFPATAGAAGVAWSPDFLQYGGDTGEANDVTIVFSGGNYVITDAGVATINDGDGLGGCTTSGNQATCPPAANVSAQLGDGNDRAELIGGTAEGFLVGSTGDDTLRGGPNIDSIYGGGATEDGPTGDREFNTGDDRAFGNGGEDFIHTGDGDDELYGGGAFDQLQGWKGNDQLFGGAGDDSLDIYCPKTDPACIDPTCPVCAPASTEGSDLLDGGPGSDGMEGTEAGYYADAVDQIRCGTGFADFANAGIADLVSADCEVIRQPVSCPAGSTGPCQGTASVQTAAGASGSAAAAARVRRVTLGRSERYKIRPGRTKKVRIDLVRRRVRRVLRGRRRVRARAVAKRRVGRKRLSAQRVRFVIRKRR